MSDSWRDEFVTKGVAADAARDAYKRIPTAAITAMMAIKQLPSAQPEITLESAIDYLHSIGWMQEHDELMYKQGYKHGKSKGIKRGMAIARRKHEE